MDNFYPVMLKLCGKTVVVIGGGIVANRKVNSLLKTGANICVVSPKLNEELKQLAEDNKILWKNKEFDKNDLKGAFLIIAATNNKEINEKVYYLKREYQLINIVDRPDLCNFQVPAMIRRGKLILTVSTSSASPILSKKIKSELEKTYTENYESYVEFLDWARKLVLAEIKDESLKKELLTSLVDPSILMMENRKEYFLEQLTKEMN